MGEATRYLSLYYQDPSQQSSDALDPDSEEQEQEKEAGTSEPSDDVEERILAVDRQLSRRRLRLDPGGYFLVRCKQREQLLELTHFPCTVDDDTGLVVDDAGQFVPAKGDMQRAEGPTVFTGCSAKELYVQLFEGEHCLVTQMNHAAYIGRELARAEECLRTGAQYIQD